MLAKEYCERKFKKKSLMHCYKHSLCSLIDWHPVINHTLIEDSQKIVALPLAELLRPVLSGRISVTKVETNSLKICSIYQNVFPFNHHIVL